VLVNEEGQHSLWPDFIDVPDGWKATYRGNGKSCVSYVDRNWSDMRPKSLIEATNRADSNSPGELGS
jgi:MbtH protein